ncbi:MAG: stage IV sporulation protein A [Firmicutes bacterium]|nr:stage IV sporulation protein A [Bacillota bacterium]
MKNGQFDLYNDIAKRTNGDIYIGVVGPVRTGKSTFISKFMEALVLPNIKDKNVLERAKDELPQSGDGKTIMTTQPKFVPAEAVKITLKESLHLNVRLIDCVGYLIPGVTGHKEGNKARLVKTPWSRKDMPFEEAAELGTKKVITNHSTIAVLVTTDGSPTGIARPNYLEAEQRVANELIESGKPFVIVVNSKNPSGEEAQGVVSALSEKFNTATIAMDVASITEADISTIMQHILAEFPIASISVKMPKWLQALPADNWLISDVLVQFAEFTGGLTKIKDYLAAEPLFLENEHLMPLERGEVQLGSGKIVYTIVPKPHLFYKVLSLECGTDILEDYQLVSFIKKLTHAKREYDKIKAALDSVAQQGYGIVEPTLSELTLTEPTLSRAGGGRFGLKLRAQATTLHIMQIDINTEVAPVVGTQTHAQELIDNLRQDFENDPQSILDTNIFGKSLHSLISEDLAQKIHSLPERTRLKLRRQLTRLVNENKTNFISFLF